ncbi:MAG: transcriptional repressor [Flavobacteriales bacterium]|nr:transcriptional repressor [Flavobacteriales bacterium]
MPQKAAESLKEKAKERLSAYLTAEGLRRTPERFAVLEAAYDMPGHFEPEDLIRKLKEGPLKVSRATVYNTLELLQQCQLIRRRDIGAGSVTYERALGFRQHDHLLCLDCGKIFEFCDPRLHTVEESMGRLLGFDVIEHNLTLSGRCQRSECGKKRAEQTEN